MSEENTSSAFDQDMMFEDLGLLCAEFHDVHQARQALGPDADPKHIGILVDRETEITGNITEFTAWRPGILLELQKAEKSKIERALGVIALLVERSGSDAPSHHRDNQYEIVGKSALVLAGLHDLRDGLPEDKEIQKGFEERVEGGEHIPGVTIEISGEHLFVNDRSLKLNPTQRVIINQILDRPDVFSYADVYESKAFQRAIEEQGYSAPPVVCLTNNLKSIKVKLAKLGIPLESLVQHGGPKHSGLLRRNPNVEVNDVDLLRLTEGLVEYLFDSADIDTPFDHRELATQFFGTDQLGARHQPVVTKSIHMLKGMASDNGMRIVQGRDGLSTIQDARGRADQALPLNRSPITRLHNNQLVHQDGTISSMNYMQESILELLDSGRQRGVTRVHVRNQLQKRRFNLKQFEVEFLRLKTLLGPNLERQQESGRTRFYLRKKIDPLR